MKIKRYEKHKTPPPSQKEERHKEQQKACMRMYYSKIKTKLMHNKRHYYENREERLQKQITYQKKRTADRRIPKLEQQLAELKSLRQIDNNITILF